MAANESESRVLYPTSIFTLEKHEIFPYERFAYQTLKAASSTLCAVHQPDSVTITFTDSPYPQKPWVLKAAVSADYDETGTVKGFTVATTPFTPLVLFAPHMR